MGFWQELDTKSRNIFVILGFAVTFLIITIGWLSMSGNSKKNDEIAMKEIPGMKMVPLEEGPLGPVLNFSTSSTGVCWIADMDVIKDELNSSQEKRLLVSIESLTPGDTTSFKPVVSEISVDELQKGIDVNLTAPGVETPTHLGLYFCKDSTGLNYCNSKKAVSYEELHDVYFDNPGKPKLAKEGYTADDKIYFFAYLLIDKNSLKILDNQMPEQTYDKLKIYLGNLPGANSELAESTVNRVKSLNQTLKSASITIDGNRLKLDLPHFDHKLCKIQSTPPETANVSKFPDISTLGK